jgi:hypothetical protein
MWADIPSDAILCTLDLEDLLDDIRNDDDCANLMNLDTFRAGAKTSIVASALREKNIVLNMATARALGKIAKAFRMAEINVTLNHLQNFVSRIIDGWSIEKSEAIDMHTMSSLAATFAMSMGSHTAGYNIQDIMRAFISGVNEGTRCMAHWSKSRSGSRRQRFRAM